MVLKILIGIFIAAGIFALGYFARGLSSGGKKKLNPEEFKALGEDFTINMRTLMDENKQHIRRWESLTTLLSSMGAVRDKHKLTNLISRTVKNELKADMSAVLLKEQNRYVCKASDGLHVDMEEKLNFPEKDSLIQFISNFPDAVVIDKSKWQFRFFHDLDDRIYQVMMMPMKMGEEVQGILWVAKLKLKKKPPPSFTNGEKAVMAYLGNVLGYLMKNLELIVKLEERAFKIVTGLAKALEQKDEYTKGHSERVASYSVMFARLAGVPRSDIEIIQRAALLHDIGKIGIPDKVLNKPGKLTADEYEMIKSHPLYGAELLKILGFLKDELILILHHHEKFDGTGYPYGLRTTEIPKGAAIISLADVFDALTTNRPYRKAFSVDEALGIMKKMRGENFDPSMLDHFIEFVESRMKGAKRAVKTRELDPGKLVK